MNSAEQGVRVTASVFGRTMVVLAGAIPFFYLAAAGENEWIESLSATGDGAVHVTAVLWGVFLAAFLAVMLWRFPRARMAATAGWALTLIPAVGLFLWGQTLV